MALFGEGSFVTYARDLPDSLSAEQQEMAAEQREIDGTESLVSWVCSEVIPFGALEQKYRFLSHQTCFLGHVSSDADRQIADWLSGFFIQEEDILGHLFTLAGFLANQAWWQNRWGEEYSLDPARMTVSYGTSSTFQM